MQERPDIVGNHLRQIKTDNKYGVSAIGKFVTSLRELEECHVWFTQDGSKIDEENISGFNEAEKHDYLVETARFNKRQTVDVQREIENLKMGLQKTNQA